VDFGLRNKILIVNDNPYSFILNDKPLSILSVPGARECCLELNSLSKAHNMSGWRIGMVGGSQELVSEVLKVKSQMDSGMFRPLQLAAVEALSQGPEWFAALNAGYRLRRVAAGRIFDLLGVRYNAESQGLFLWGKVPEDSPLVKGRTEETLGERLSEAVLHGAGVFITPGFIFGRNGSGYVRISLCAPVETLEKAYDRIRNVL
jgi:aspartate/methionine/tyrosine aminotransferase